MGRTASLAAGLSAAFLFALATAAAAEPVTPPPIAARAYLLVDALSGQAIAGAGVDERNSPASLTKLMTAYLAFAALREHRLPEDALVTVSAKASKARGSRMFLDPRTPVAVHDLLLGLIVDSGNDAAIALAEAIAGSEEAFVELMNRQAQALGLANTHFANASGESAPGHYSSARDLATLALALIRDFPDRYALYSTRTFTYSGIAQSNRNRLLWTDATVDGVKTGFTEAAGYCLVASAKRGERRLLSVVLGTRSETLRTSESQRLLNFGFQAYDTRRVYSAGKPVAQAEVYKGTSATVSLGFATDVWITLPREDFAGLKPVLQTRRPFVAPLAAGEKAGIMKLMRDDAQVAQFPVVALEDVPVAGFLSRGWDTIRLQLLAHSLP